MRSNFSFKTPMLKWAGIAAVGFTALTSNVSRADVMQGYDIFQSSPTSYEATANFQGVPIGNYDFGGSIGTRDVGNADTIIHRSTLAPSGPDSGTATLTVNALQLVTTQQWDLAGMFGLPNNNGYYYATLDPNKTSGGSMTINGVNDIGSKTFHSDLTLYLGFSVCGSIGVNGQPNSCGSTVFMEKIMLSQDGTWDRAPNPLYSTGPLAGVDYQLNGINTDADFWIPKYQEYGTAYVYAITDPNYLNPIAGPLNVLHETPEPATLSLFALGTGLMGFRRRKAA